MSATRTWSPHCTLLIEGLQVSTYICHSVAIVARLIFWVVAMEVTHFFLISYPGVSDPHQTYNSLNAATG